RGMAEPAEGRGRDRRHRGAARPQRIRRRRIAQACDRRRAEDRRSRAPTRHGGRSEHMSDPALGLLMLALIVVVIMLGFPTAFTLMGLGMFFGYIAFYDPMQLFSDNRVFDLMVQRTYGAMTNDVLISIPLFVLMGYVMERGALVDKMFYSIQLAFRRVPASLAVATLIVCTFWGIASGLVGAVVVLMGVIAFNPMLKAGYNVKLAAGVITASCRLRIHPICRARCCRRSFPRPRRSPSRPTARPSATACCGATSPRSFSRSRSPRSPCGASGGTS